MENENRPQKDEPTTTETTNITPRQQEALQWFAQGLTVKEVAARMGIRFHTADTHRKNLLKRTGQPNLAALVHFAVQHKLLEVKGTDTNE